MVQRVEETQNRLQRRFNRLCAAVRAVAIRRWEVSDEND